MLKESTAVACKLEDENNSPRFPILSEMSDRPKIPM